MSTVSKIKVMLATEGTYPFSHGGVSTWCDVLLRNLERVDFVIYSIIMNPYVTQKFTLPENSSLIRVPLWGTEDASEHLLRSFSEIYLAKKRTDIQIVEKQFLPQFISLIEQIISPEKDPVLFAQTVHALYRYFQQYDYRESFKAQITWEVFKNIITASSSDSGKKLPWPSAFDLIQSLGWIYRFFTILNTPVPKVDVAHSAAAAFCGIPCVIAKLEHKTPFLLTEHGVYLREQYLAANRASYSSYLKTFLIRLVQSISTMNYHMADQVSPVCKYNTRWEEQFDVKPSKIEVIYNGVNQEQFAPGDAPAVNVNPTVVTVARIDPVKDIISLIKAAELVSHKIPEVKFMVYGTVSVQKYYEECMDLVKKLNLQDHFVIAGHTEDVPSVLRQADVIALSSITEAFPYSVVEAMMAGKAIVSTDVGGVSEALGEAGLIVQPGQYEDLAKAIIRLLKDTELREHFGQEASKRALNFFTLERATQLYYKAYKKLFFNRINRFETKLLKQKLYADKGYALAELGLYEEAIEQFNQAIKESPDSSAVPVLLTEIAIAYTELGQLENAKIYLYKAGLVAQFLDESIA
ncbi:MAG: GT4 family glycosyltransferase PelF [Peptococcaceae bacterium]|nr:GT4 family glycosyltransferase PelF [Peptococcaceae bacterium]